MVRSYPALTTLIRNKLNRDIPEAFNFFHEKGVTMNIEDENLFSLQTEKNGHSSELIEVCYNGLIYRGPELVCYKGPRVPQITLTEAKNLATIKWDKTTVFSEKVVGKKMFMYWDSQKEDWQFADESKAINNSYGKLLKNKLYNVYNIEYFFTFVFIIVENDKIHEPGTYLETMYDNKTGKEVDWKTVWSYATRLKTKPVQYYYFEGFDKLDASDFPIYVYDMNNNRILLTEV